MGNELFSIRESTVILVRVVSKDGPLTQIGLNVTNGNETVHFTRETDSIAVLHCHAAIRNEYIN